MTFRRRPPFAAAALVAALAALAGCSSFGDPIEAIGARRPAPDEFKVLPRKPLVVPETLARASALPAPEPGKPSPLEPDPQREAVAALMGAEAAPQPTTTASLSAGETALLSAADASAGRSEIRVQLETDRQRAAESDANKPYEAPTLIELFGGGSDEEELDPAVALDAIAESQRLQREGVAAPNDPLATAATDGESGGPFSTGAPPQNADIYSESLDRRPQNPLTGNAPPAFE